MKRGGFKSVTDQRLPSLTAGFTIVETMIVLGVTGILFVSLVGMVVGQQGKSQFKNAMTSIVADLRSNISQVSGGHYPAAGMKFSCTVSGGKAVVAAALADNEQGTNKDCTFMGQAITFVTGTDTNDNQQYKVYTLVGLRELANKQPPKTLSESGVAVPQELSITKTLPYGVKVSNMYVYGNSAKKAIGAAIVLSPEGQMGQTSAVESGAVLPSIFALPCNATIMTNCTDFADTNNKDSKSAEVAKDALTTSNASHGVEICFNSGTNNQSALVKLGAGGSTESVEMTIYGKQGCTD